MVNAIIVDVNHQPEHRAPFFGMYQAITLFLSLLTAAVFNVVVIAAHPYDYSGVMAVIFFMCLASTILAALFWPESIEQPAHRSAARYWRVAEILCCLPCGRLSSKPHVRPLRDHPDHGSPKADANDNAALRSANSMEADAMASLTVDGGAPVLSAGAAAAIAEDRSEAELDNPLNAGSGTSVGDVELADVEMRPREVDGGSNVAEDNDPLGDRGSGDGDIDVEEGVTTEGDIHPDKLIYIPHAREWHSSYWNPCASCSVLREHPFLIRIAVLVGLICVSVASLGVVPGYVTREYNWSNESATNVLLLAAIAIVISLSAAPCVLAQTGNLKGLRIGVGLVSIGT